MAPALTTNTPNFKSATSLLKNMNDAGALKPSDKMSSFLAGDTGFKPDQLADINKEMAQAVSDINVKDAISAVTSLPLKSSMFFHMFAWISIIVMVIVIVVFASIAGSKGKFNSKIAKVKNSTLKGTAGLWFKVKTVLNKLDTFFKMSPGTRNLFSRFSLNDTEIPSVERDKSFRGRCDNLYFKESDIGNVCDSTLNPKNIEWELDIRKFSEFNELPAYLQNELIRKLKVTIPWRVNSTFFSPQCNEAKFEDGSSAGHLLQDYGMSCQLKESTLSDYEAFNLGTNRVTFR